MQKLGSVALALFTGINVPLPHGYVRARPEVTDEALTERSHSFVEFADTIWGT